MSMTISLFLIIIFQLFALLLVSTEIVLYPTIAGNFSNDVFLSILHSIHCFCLFSCIAGYSGYLCLTRKHILSVGSSTRLDPYFSCLFAVMCTRILYSTKHLHVSCFVNSLRVKLHKLLFI